MRPASWAGLWTIERCVEEPKVSYARCSFVALYLVGVNRENLLLREVVGHFASFL